MYSFSSQHKYFWYREPTDMRKSFNGLCGLVTNEMKQNPTNGSVYIFVNKRADKIKILVWDRNGFVIYYKTLESGTYEWPKFDESDKSYKINWDELLMILEGVQLNSIKRKKRYSYTHLVFVVAKNEKNNRKCAKHYGKLLGYKLVISQSLHCD